MRKMNIRFAWIALPMILCFLLLYVLPFVLSIRYSFIKSAFDESFVWLDNYIRVIQNEYFRLALINTFRFTAISVPTLMALSISFSILFFELPGNHRVIVGGFVLPMLIPCASVVLLFKLLFDPASGALVKYIAASRLPALAVHTIFIWKNLGFNIILLRSSMQMMPPEISEAAKLDGAGFVRRHIYITLPYISPTLFFVFILSTVYSFRVFKETYLLFGSYPTDGVYFLQHYMNNHFMKLNYQYLTTAAFLFFIIVYLIVSAGYRLSKTAWRDT